MSIVTKDITTAYSEALVEVGKTFENVVVLDSDIADSCKTEPFRTAFPDRSFDLGVAEQSLPTFAAGLALVGKIPFYNSFAVFAVHRGLDMIRQSVAYNRANVKIVGHAAGQSMGYTGPSHHTLEDFSALRALPHFIILSPSDAVETRKMVWKMVETDGPTYLRLSRVTVPVIHSDSYSFKIGKTERLRDGVDVSIFATGDLVAMALDVHERLRNKTISSQVVNVPTIKPLLAEEIIKHGELTAGAITIEDHNIYGGLGSAVAEIYAEYLRKPLKRIGIPDTFTESDECSVLRSAYGINVENVVQKVCEVIDL